MTDSKYRRADDRNERAACGRRLAVDRQARGLVLTLLILSLYIGLAIVVTHPLWLHLADSVPGDIGDPLLNTWILAWDAHALLTDPLHLFDANIFYPLPNTLAYSEHLLSTAILVLPWGLVTGEPVLAYNFGLLLSFPLAGLGMYLLVLRWTGRRGAGLLAGLAFAFAPYRLAAIAHLQLLTVQWFPFSLLALDRLLGDQGIWESGIRSAKDPDSLTTARNPSPGRDVSGIRRFSNSHILFRILSFVIFGSLQILASWYLAVFTGLVLGLYAVGWLLMHWKPWVRRQGLGLAHPARVWGLVGAAVVVAGLAILYALPYLDVLPELQAARPVSLAASFAAWPSDFLTAASYLRLAGPVTRGLAERPGFTEENTLFLGVVGPLLAWVGLAAALLRPDRAGRWRVFVLAAIVAVSLALTFAGPYRSLTRLLPALTVVRVPPRWVIPATFALSALAGYGAVPLRVPGTQRRRKSGNRVDRSTHPPRSVSGRHRRVLILVLGLLLVAESFAAPLPLAHVGTRDELPSVYYALRGEALRAPGEWGVIELPMHVAPAPEFPETKRLYASTLGWWGLVNGYSGLTPRRQIALDQLLADFPDQKAFEALRALGAQGVRYLVVHPGEAPLNRDRWETVYRWQIERQPSFLPVGAFGPDELYLVNPYGEGLITQPADVGDAYWSVHGPTPVDVCFSSPDSDYDIYLLSYVYQSGDRLLEERLTLYWRASTGPDTDYTVFVHSLDSNGALIGQADGPPVADHYPTTSWRPGEVVQDSRPVPAGDHYLVGLYDPVSGERLPAFTPDGSRLAGDAVVLPAVQR
jgi:hypothetical protein